MQQPTEDRVLYILTTLASFLGEERDLPQRIQSAFETSTLIKKDAGCAGSAGNNQLSSTIIDWAKDLKVPTTRVSLNE